MSPTRAPERRNASPRYRVYLSLRDQLDRGQIRHGERLPTELELARRHGVARGTVREALGQLVRDGRIVRRQGAGTTVLAAPATDRGTEAFPAVLDNLQGISQRTRVQMLRYELTLTPQIVVTYEHAFGPRALLIERARSYRGTRFALVRHFVPERLSRKLTRHRLGTKATAMALEKAGISIGKGEQWVGAVAADTRASEALEVPVGAPLLHVQRFVRDARRELIEYQEGLYRPEFYRVRMGVEWRALHGADKQWVPSSPE